MNESFNFQDPHSLENFERERYKEYHFDRELFRRLLRLEDVVDALKEENFLLSRKLSDHVVIGETCPHTLR